MEDDAAVVIGCGAVGLGAVLGLAQKNVRRVIAVEYETKLFVQKELEIRGSRNATPQNFRRVIDFARRGLFPVGKMLTKTYDFAGAGQALADWDAAPGKVCRFLVKVS